MVRATWMADRQSPGLLGCVGGSEWHRHDGQIMGCLASEGKVFPPGRKALERLWWVGGFPLYGPVSGSRLPRSGENGPIWLGRVLEEHPADGERKAEG